MILYYRCQIKENGIWHNDETHSPIAVRQEEAYRLIGNMNLNDDERLIIITESEALENNLREIFWITLDARGRWEGMPLPVHTELPYFWFPGLRFSFIDNFHLN